MKRSAQLSLALLLGLTLAIGMATSAFALGTPAGDTISNLATLNYDVGTVAQTAIESAPGAGNSTPGIGNGTNTDFLVDSKVDLAMAVTNTAATGTGNIMPFVITNNGNDTQTYQLQLYSGASPADDQFDMSNLTIYADLDGSGTITAGDVALTVGAGNVLFSGATAYVSPDIAANGTLQVLVIGDVPASTADGATAKYTLIANTFDAGGAAETTNASTGTNGVAVVLADGAAGAGVTGVTADVVENGAYLVTGTFTVNSATITVAKTYVVVSDPINGTSSPKAIPGAVIRYTITITNAGSADADNVVLTDAIPGNTLFSTSEAATASGTGVINYDYGSGFVATAPTDDSGTGAQTNSAMTDIRISYATIPATTGTATITFAVTVQ